jgi:hypothetical protein
VSLSLLILLSVCLVTQSIISALRIAEVYKDLAVSAYGGSHRPRRRGCGVSFFKASNDSQRGSRQRASEDFNRAGSVFVFLSTGPFGLPNLRRRDFLVLFKQLGKVIAVIHAYGGCNFRYVHIGVS